jgi:hypothetical protein
VYTHLGECTVVPDVAVVREAIADETQATFLDVLFDRVEGFFLGKLHLGVGPSGNLHDHVQNAIALVRKKWDVMKRRHDATIVLDVDAMICQYGSQSDSSFAVRCVSVPSVLGAPMRRGVYAARW